MKCGRALTALLLSLSASAVGSVTLPAQGGRLPDCVPSVVRIVAPADHMVGNVLQLAVGEAVRLQVSAVATACGFGGQLNWMPRDSAVVTVEAGSQSAVPLTSGGMSRSWNAIARARVSGDTSPARVSRDTSIVFESGLGPRGTLRVHVVNTILAPTGASTRVVPLSSRVSVAAPAVSSVDPQGFAARYLGKGVVAFSWQLVPDAAGVAVYDARTGQQLSPMVYKASSWLSAPLPAGSYTFVAASWRSPSAGAPPVVSGMRSAPALVTIPIY